MLTGFVLLMSKLLWAQSPCDSLPMITIQASDTTPCSGEEIVLQASGGVIYNWNNGVSNAIAFTPSASETYQVTVTDTNGCVDSASVYIEVLTLPDVVANSSSYSICLGDSVLLEANNAASYNWITPSISNGSYYTPTTSGTNVFEVEGTGANGCTNTSQLIVLVSEIPSEPTLNQNSIATCLNVAFDGEVIASTTDGRIIWYEDEALTELYEEQSELPLMNSTVGVTTYWATSFENGCYSEGVEATVEVYALPELDAGEDVTVEAGKRGELVATTNVPVVATWSPEVNLDNPYDLETGYTAIQSTNYTVFVEDENGCTNTDELEFTVKSNLVISNLITPDGNGENDTWKIYPRSTLSTCTVKLYDGFGRELLNTDNYQNDWDGTYNGEAVPDGDYYYYIQGNDGYSKKGTLTLLR